MNAVLPNGVGAMLARIVSLGRRCGLAPEAVLLHVLDGAPLAEQAAAHCERPDRAGETVGENSQDDTATDARKGERVLQLYGTTALSNPAIARLVETSAQTVSWFIRQGRQRGDERARAGDLARGRLTQDEPCIQQDAYRAEDLAAEDGLLVDTTEADPAVVHRDQARPNIVGWSSSTIADRVLYLWAKTELTYGDIARLTGVVVDDVYDLIRAAKDAGGRRFQDGYDRRRTPPVPLSPQAAEVAPEAARHATDMPVANVTPIGEAPASKDPQPAAGPANAGGDHDVAQQQQPDVTGRATGEPASMGVDPVALENSAETANEAPMAVVSPERATEVAGEPEASPPASDRADPPAPPPVSPPAEKGTVRRASDSAVRPARPGPDTETAETAPAPAADHIVTVDAMTIVGPRGTLKGFPLVNAILQVLSPGALLPAASVAQRAGARSPAAVQAVLKQWADDLSSIGIEIVHFGESIRLRRAAAP
ncbi:hypothetical protein ABE438_17545 [Bosea sp. TWI1241]|uniref:hypothetical protein n=1 Tax=Bosea sp. TWI1241 TaxID=3148904 RepID=UPI003209B22C